MQKEILKWLQSGADALQGVGLLEKYATNLFLVRLVKSNPTKNSLLIKDSLCRLAKIDLTKVVNKPSREIARIGFRDEFPFLDSPTCPFELKALVTDKFTSFYRYKELHRKLSDCTSLEECYDTASELLASYRDNRAIYAELNYYKQHKLVLGKHQVFKHFNNLKQLREMSLRDLIEKERKLLHNIWRIESEIAKNDKPELLEDRKQRLDQKRNELAEVQRLL